MFSNRVFKKNKFLKISDKFKLLGTNGTVEASIHTDRNWVHLGSLMKNYVL
jgi:hypothetical protein